MTLRPACRLLTAFRSRPAPPSWLGYAEGSLAVLIATLISQKAHRAGLPEYLTLYPLAVAAVSALWGIRHGLFAALLSVVLTRVALVQGSNSLFPAGAECIRLFAISFSTFAAAALVGVVREQRDQLARSADALRERQAQLVTMHQELQASESRREEFCREILLAVSHGKLRLTAPEAMRLDGKRAVMQVALSRPADISTLRHAAADLGRSMGMDAERVQDLSVCLGEAATNAVVHAEGGHATVYADDQALWLHVVDRGPGIDREELPRATLLKGYSTKTSLGMGFSLMLELADSVSLATSSEGTQILLEMNLQAPQANPLDLALLGLDLDETWDAVPMKSED